MRPPEGEMFGDDTGAFARDVAVRNRAEAGRAAGQVPGLR